MRRMIAAQSYRLIHEKGFWGGLAVTILYALAVLAFSAYAMINNGRSIALDQLYFYGYGLDSFIPVAGLVLAAVISFFVGTEYSSQTLRNALIIGRTRTEIYLSHYAVSLIVALIYQGVYALIVVLVGWPVFGGFHLSGALIGLGTLIGVLALAAYCALFNAVGLLSSSRTVSSIGCLCGVMLTMFLCFFLNTKLQEPEWIEALEMRDGSSQVYTLANPSYLNPSQRRFVQGVIDSLPSGQSLQLSGLNCGHWAVLPPISLIGIVLVQGIGLLLFQRKELR